MLADTFEVVARCFSNCCQVKLSGFSSDDEKNGIASKFLLDAVLVSG